ncbi:DHA2 family efflux MFS transporter permease subunit [Legionella fallonii]|uniref:Multidrug efflux system protein n=1 Tax=Legionella fallonii LLAP-10 TaxID=1212491 RepID=A0A098G4B6_9GAMM|nr:DHA2 family efflux MFS transporter permease subunit [Legionella fallonii]CEG57312.1 multidrug efflux system protein [Legionella fallonii LLAP-10]
MSAQPPQPAKGTPPPLQGVQLVIATIAVALATFMIVLDSSIANVALPTIAGNLGVSADEGTWVITVFSAANAIAIPLTGWLTLRFGVIRLFVVAIVLFVLASWLCGLANNFTFLLCARVFQGIVAGPLIPLSQSILLSSYPKEKSSLALAFWGMTATVGPIAGPTLGGWITDSYSWSWIFYINIPVGIFAATLTWIIYKDRETPRVSLPIDVVGLVLLVIWVGALQIMLDKGKDLDWFNSPVIITLGITSAITFCYFLVWELTEKNPIVDLTLFASRNFTGGTIAISVGYGVFFGNLVLLPQWLQIDQAYPSVNAGLVMAPLGIFAVICSPIVGKILPKVDARIIVTIAFLLLGLVFFLRSLYTSYVDTWHLVVPTLIQGIPIALFFIPLSAIILSGLPPERIPAAAGLSNFARIFSGAIGTSIATTAWNNRSILHHAQLTEQATLSNPNFVGFINTSKSLLHITTQQSYGLFNSILNVEADMLGLNDVFWISSIIFIALIPVVWITKKAAPGSSTDSSAGAH